MVTLGQLPQEQKVTWRIDRVNGDSYRRTWFGSENQLKLIAAVERRFAESLDFTSDGGRCTLVGNYQNRSGKTEAEVARESQEIDTESLHQHIFSNKTFQPLTPSEQNLLRKIVENNETYADAMTVIMAPPVQVITAAGLVEAGGVAKARQALAIRAYNLLIRGDENFENPAYILNRTRSVSRSYPGVLRLDWNNTLWTTDQLVTYSGNPTLFEVPSLTITYDEAVKRLFPSWRMTLCRVTDVSDGTRQMIEQWKLAKWSRDLYDLRPTT